MVRTLRACGLIATILGLLFASSAIASPRGRLRATATEDFVSTGCSFTPSPSADLCGTAKTKGFGKATIETVITSFAPLPSGCFADTHTSTLHFKRDDNSLVLDISGTLCPTGGPNFTFSGGYTVAGGTGDFAGATGSGSATSVRQDGPIVEEFSGTI